MRRVRACAVIDSRGCARHGARMQRVRGSCVAVEGRGVLLTGESGAGKSDLALRLIDEGARLVADDYTQVTLVDGKLLASAPELIDGLLEVRGLGIVRLSPASPTSLAVVITLAAGVAEERLPPPSVAEVLGVGLPQFTLDPFACSATAKVRLAVKIATGGIMRIA